MNFKNFGKEPLCNHRADRGIWIHGFCLPLCFRCTGLLAGGIAGTIALWLAGEASPVMDHPAAGLAAGCILILPTAADGLLEYAGGRESTNRRRMVTGIMAGIGCALVEEALRRLAGWM